jgi:hypothetical protein
MESKLATSRTLDSLHELQQVAAATGTPSIVSSGYGSQAVSSNTLSSDDCGSVRSISADDTPDNDLLPNGHHAGNNNKQLTAHDLLDAMASSAVGKTDASLLSPPDVSLTSITPGDDTEAIVIEEKAAVKRRNKSAKNAANRASYPPLLASDGNVSSSSSR